MSLSGSLEALFFEKQLHALLPLKESIAGHGVVLGLAGHVPSDKTECRFTCAGWVCGWADLHTEQSGVCSH